MANKKILIFCHDAVLYGATRSLLDLLFSVSSDANISMLVVVPETGDFTNILAANNIPFKTVYYPRNVSFYKPKLSSLKKKLGLMKRYYKYYRSINHELYHFNPDVIYTNTSVIYWGALIAILSFKKHVWHLRELNDAYNMHRDFGRSFFHFLLRRSNSIICNSYAVVKEYNLTNKNHVHVVYNGIVSENEATGLFVCREQPTGGLLHLGLAGAIHPSKGQLEVLMAFAKYKSQAKKDFRIYIAGNSIHEDYFSKIEKFIDEADLVSKVEFKGFQENMDTFYSSIDMLICGSFSEAFGRVIPEAMIRGIPVIARNVGGIPEIITHGYNGMLFNSEEELTICLDRLGSDPFLFSKIRENGYNTVLKKFTKERYVNEIKAILVNSISFS